MSTTSPMKIMIKSVKKQPTPAVAVPAVAVPAVAVAVSPPIEIHSLMVGENRDDVHLYLGRTRAEMVANFLADGDFDCLCEDGPDAQFIADLEAKLAQAPQHFDDETFKHYGEAFTVGNSDSDLFQYVVTRL
jgi:hypothetical protein